MEEIKVFCPATIANVSCGFDVLGLALDSVGDEMMVRKTAELVNLKPNKGCTHYRSGYHPYYPRSLPNLQET